MLLHRYFGSHAFDTLRDAMLKTSKISSFNDSFEFLYVSRAETTPAQIRRFLNSHFCDPGVITDLIEAAKKSSIPLSDAEIKRRISEAVPSLVEDGVKAWPSIVKQTELSIERRRQIIDEELRAICFSYPERVKKEDEILLWSHYANKNQGVRIGFHFPYRIKEEIEIREITYQKDRVAVVWSLGDEGTMLKALEQSATVKSSAWEYEKEFRLFTKTSACEPLEITENGSTKTEEHFLKFPREWIVQVDFGVFCPDSSIREISELLAANYPKVVPRKAQFHESQYAFEYKPVS